MPHLDAQDRGSCARCDAEGLIPISLAVTKAQAEPAPPFTVSPLFTQANSRMEFADLGAVSPALPLSGLPGSSINYFYPAAVGIAVCDPI